MKKKLIPLITMLLTVSLVTACGEDDSVAPPTDSSNNYGDTSGGTTSNPDDSGDDHGQQLEGLDQVIAAFYNGIDVKVPALDAYGLEYDIVYNYQNSVYYIYATGADAENALETTYAALFTSDTNLVTANDPDYYSIEDYGHMYMDASQNAFINFYSEEGSFYITLYRYDGLYGTLDVSNVDTSWYVDYVNEYGFKLVEEFPDDFLIKDFLNIESEVTVPSYEGEAYLYLFVPAYEDEEGSAPDTFYIVLQDDQLLDYGAVLEEAGYTVDIKENTETSLFGEDVAYYTVTAFDSDNTIYISMQLDESENTLVTINNFSDLFTAGKTTNTDWTDEEKALMNSILHQVLPFMAFGDGYMVYEDNDGYYDMLVVEDSYLEDLTNDYIALLLENGFSTDSTSYDDTCYYYDNGYVYIEIFVGYEDGNYLVVYYENTKLPALTSLELNASSLDIVAGATYQLTPVYNPSNAKYPLTWTSSNENVATVDNNGLVTIKNDAANNSSAVITATASTGKTASCTFNVKANEVTGIVFNQDNYNVIPGGTAVQTSYTLLPYGIVSNESASYTVEPNNVGVSVSNSGALSAEATASVGATATLKVAVGGVSATATVKVVSASVTHTLNRDFFGIKQSDYSTYKTYTVNTDDGATYKAYAAGNNGIQIKSKTSDSGIIGHFEGRTCKSITFTFDANTEVPNQERKVDIYASNSPFTIEDMFGSSVTKVGSVTFDKNNLTQTYTFTGEYSYIGFRSNNGAVYLPSVQIVW